MNFPRPPPLCPHIWGHILTTFAGAKEELEESFSCTQARRCDNLKERNDSLIKNSVGDFLFLKSLFMNYLLFIVAILLCWIWKKWNIFKVNLLLVSHIEKMMKWYWSQYIRILSFRSEIEGYPHGTKNYLLEIYKKATQKMSLN